MAIIKVNWNKYKRWAFEILLVETTTQGGKFMWKKILKWVKAVGKKELIEVISGQQDDLERLIQKVIDTAEPETLAQRLSVKVISWIVEKIEKI